MAAEVPIKSDDIRIAIQHDGRPVRLSSKLQGGSNSGTISSPFSNQGAGDIILDPGRAMWVETILITSDQPGYIFGFSVRDSFGHWVNTSLDQEIAIGTPGQAIPIPVNAPFYEGFRVSATLVPSSSIDPIPEPTVTIEVFGIEFTNDQNFKAEKKFLMVGDSPSWSLIGDYLNYDMGYNYNLYRGSFPQYPSYKGKYLAPFRLADYLRDTRKIDIRQVNKGFGGSKMATDQWWAAENGLYNFDWNVMMIEAGSNDASELQDPLYQLTFKQRMQDIVNTLNNNRRKDFLRNTNTRRYPLVFCDTITLDDRSGGVNSRNNMDVRKPVLGSGDSSEAYDQSFNSGSVTEIDFTNVNTNYMCRVFGDGSNQMTFTGGSAGEVYRVDFHTDTTLLTGEANVSGVTYPYIRVLEALLTKGESNAIPEEGDVTIDAGTTIFFECVDANTYHELERVKLSGEPLEIDANEFDVQDPENPVKHFVTAVNTAATKIKSINIPSITQTADINSATVSTSGLAGNIVQFNIGSGITNELLPSSGVISDLDVWVKVSGIANTGSPIGVSWADLNGFYRVQGYGGNVSAIQVLLNARDASGHDFDGHGDFSSATIELIKTEGYIAQFEGSSYNTSSNCSYFEHGEETVTVDGDDYTVKTNLIGGSDGSRFNLVAGQGIAISVHQQGNVIYMNEVCSGAIENMGVVLGAVDRDAFYSNSNEEGKTRLVIVRDAIRDFVSSMSENENIHLVQLYDESDVPSVSYTAGGRMRYLEQNYTKPSASDSSEISKVSDLMYAPLFKGVSGSGNTERQRGNMVHRSPEGQRLFFERMKSQVFENLVIP